MPANTDRDKWIARLAIGTGDAWRLPDGEIVHGFFEAERKAKETGAVLEERKKSLFSPSH
ncbi:hypothetical protein [Arsenophonus nasoniae]|uniref:hypothetical protein n=1 Tax=Arsenophonus nasoniae TaxID=638 RepID=UPI00387A64CE